MRSIEYKGKEYKVGDTIMLSELRHPELEILCPVEDLVPYIVVSIDLSCKAHLEGPNGKKKVILGKITIEGEGLLVFDKII